MRSKSADGGSTFTETARRAQIVQSATEVIAELGYPQASIRKIAERVGVAMSVVLYHFKSKDELIEAVVEQMYRTAFLLVGSAVEAEPTAVGKLTAYIRASIEFFDTHRVQQIALAEIWSNYRSRSGRRLDELGLSPLIREQLASLDPESLLRAGQREGEFRDFPTAPTASALRSALNGVVAEVMRDPDFDVHGYGENLVELFGRATRRSK